MPIDKLTPRKLNKQADSRLIKRTEAVDALNVRYSTDEEGNEGVIKNAYGNVLIPATLSEGGNRCIGYVSNESKNEMFYFVWNEQGNHSIYRYNSSTDAARRIYSDSVFDFRKTDYVRADLVISANGDTHIVFSTGRGEVYMLNATKAERGGYPRFTISTPAERRLKFVTLCKQPPMHPPTFDFVTDESKDYNFLAGKMFQFAAQYVYDDGQVSVLSPYSKIAFSNTSVLYDRASNASGGASDNNCVITVASSDADVKFVRVFAREGNLGNFYEVKEVPNAGNNVTVNFFNDQTYRILGKDEENKLFDAVPIDAQALRFSNNRLFIGDYKEDFDVITMNVDPFVRRSPLPPVYNVIANNLRSATGALSTNIQGTAVYSVNTATNPISGTLDGTDIRRFGVQLDFRRVPDDGVYAGSAIRLDFSMYYSRIQHRNDPFNADTNFFVILNNGYYRARYVNHPTTPRLYGGDFSVKRVIKITEDLTKAQVMALVETELTKPVVSNLSPDLTSTGYAFDMAPGVINVDTIRVWIGGNIVGSFEKAADSTTDLLNLNFKIDQANLSVIKAQFLQNNKDIVITSSQIDGTRYFGGTYASGIGKFFITKNVVNFTGNAIIEKGSIQHFKSNASHIFGIQYHDHRLRRSTVHPIAPVFVPFIDNGNEQEGVASVSFKILHAPPPYARTYQLVYAGNDRYTYYEQYSVAEAFAGSSTGFDFQAIYLAMSTLEGKPNSFQDGKYGKINYQFAEGDRLRILRYKILDEGSYGYVPQQSAEFEIVDYRFFDETDTPITATEGTSQQQLYRKTGWFLIIRDKALNGWSSSNIINKDDNWKFDVVVEIYRPKKSASELIYREIGESYDIVQDNVLGAIHVGNKRTKGQSVTVTAIITGSGTDGWQIQTDAEVFVGEGIVFTAESVLRSFTITNVTKENNNLFTIQTQQVISGDDFNVQGSYVATIINVQTIVQVNDGDSYLRPRLIKVNASYNPADAAFTQTTKYEYQNVEAQSLSDFFESNWYSYGKPNAVITDAKKKHRRTTVTYSDAYVLDSDRFNISSFNNSLANWVDYDNYYGGIRYLGRMGDSFIVVQERKASRVQLGRNIIEYTDGQQNATLSNNVISDKPQYYAQDYGCNDNVESVVVDDRNRVYFVDAKQRKVVRVGEGIDVISNVDMETFFNNLFFGFNNRAPFYRIYAGYDQDINEYILSTRDLNSVRINVYFNPVTLPIGEREADISFFAPVNDSGDIIIDVIENTNAVLTPDRDPRPPDDICEDMEDWGGAVVYLDILNTQPFVYVPDGYIDALDTNTFPVIVTSSDFDFFAVGSYNLQTKILTFANTVDCLYDYINVISEGDLTVFGETVAFNTSDNYWTTRYSFKPEMILGFNDKVFTWSNGLLYKHTEDAHRLTFYGTVYPMTMDLISNYDPSKVKFYKAYGIEGNTPVDAQFFTEDQQAFIDDLWMVEKERQWYWFIPRSELASTANYVFVGIYEVLRTFWILEFGTWNDSGVWNDDAFWVDFPTNNPSPTSNAIVLKNKIGQLHMAKGAEIFRVPASVVTQAINTGSAVFTPAATNMTFGTTIGEKEVTFVGTNVLADGDYLYIKKDATIDGDLMRGTWLQNKITVTKTTPVEIYAINFDYSTSRLHNELGEVNTERE
jgi:nuclear transport factor 2 (NTF2) superfamily protein